MRKTMVSITAAAILALATLPLHAAIYMKVDGIRGNVTAAGHERWIQLESYQFGMGHSGVGTAKQQLPQLCSSRVLPAVLMDVDGVRHTLRDVSFSDCRQEGNETTFRMTVEQGVPTALRSQTEARQGAPRQLPAAAETPNVIVTGMTRVPVQNNLKQMMLSANSATMYIGSANGGVWKTTDGGKSSPLVVVEGIDGTRLTFTNARLEEVVPATLPTTRGGSASQVLKITLVFETTTATPELVEKIVRGR